MTCCDRDLDMAADVLQQAYSRILSGEAVFRRRSDFSTWVFGVIRHVALEERRGRRRRQLRLLATPSELASPVEHCPVEQRELSELLNNAMQDISARQREVLHLVFYQDMTIEQAAVVLEIAVGSARQHYHRGKEALRRALHQSQEIE